MLYHANTLKTSVERAKEISTHNRSCTLANIAIIQHIIYDTDFFVCARDNIDWRMHGVGVARLIKNLIDNMVRDHNNKNALSEERRTSVGG